MTEQLIERRDADFVLWEQLGLEEKVKTPRFKEFNKKTCDMILNEAKSLAIKELLPTLAEGDKLGVTFENGTVTVPECFKRPFELLKEGEWPGLAIDPEMGGQGAPKALGSAVTEYFLAANWAVSSYATMGTGTALMISLFGTSEQKEMYLEKVLSGHWGGTMLLTESDAGSDVGALSTTAVKNPDGTYSLTGSKIFITNGEHNLAENIVHPVLARIEGDPPGTKGISIFLVPKYHVNPDGSLGKENDIVCTGVEEKHGIHGSATCSMSLGAKGQCIGHLLGEERKGMAIMFHMMNDARMSTGLQGLAYASAAYLEALNYARQRVQGRDLADFANRDAASVAIINHPDVRRNLLRMKAYVNGMRSFYYYTANIGEDAELAGGKEKDPLSEAFFALLTPIIKEYLAFMGHDLCIQAIQVFGGAGYTQDYIVEQLARDCKIATIYEGTSGIQAMDLLARKISAQKGAAYQKLMGEIQGVIAQAREIETLSPLADKVETALNRLVEVTLKLGAKAASAEAKTAFAHSLPYLHAMGDVIMAWMLLWRAVVAVKALEGGCSKKDTAFYNGQIKTAEFFILTELYGTLGKLNAIEEGTSAAVDMENESFAAL